MYITRFSFKFYIFLQRVMLWQRKIFVKVYRTFYASKYNLYVFIRKLFLNIVKTFEVFPVFFLNLKLKVKTEINSKISNQMVLKNYISTTNYKLLKFVCLCILENSMH